MRETDEETGYSVEIQNKLPDLSYQTNNGEHVTLSMYLAIAKEKISDPEPGTHSRWISIDDVEKQLSYDNLKEFWRSIRTMIS
jgi:hypothetical protein